MYFHVGLIWYHYYIRKIPVQIFPTLDEIAIAHPNMNVNLLWTRNPWTGTLTNSEDSDEMPHNAAFHQGLHCLLSQNQSSEKENKAFFEIITCASLIYTLDHPDLTVSNFMGTSIGIKSLKVVTYVKTYLYYC